MTTQQLPAGWRETTLGEVGKVITGKTPSTKENSFWNGSTPFITPTDIDNTSRFCIPSRSISEYGKKSFKTSITPKNAICYTSIASIGLLCITDQESLTNQQINSLILNNQNYFLFFYYYLIFLTPFLKRMAGGTTTHIINKTQFEKTSVCIPPLPEQQAIASVLSAFDDKIELLREESKTLEALGQTIFKEWFGKYSVDEPESLPEGWRVGKLSDIADFLNGIALQKFPPKDNNYYLPVIKIRELKSGITSQTDKANIEIDKKYIIDNGDVLFSRSGSLEVVIRQHGKGALNQHLFKVSSNEYPKRFYYFWTLYHLPEFKEIASYKATTMGHIQRHHLDNAKIIIPNEKDMEKLNGIFSNLLDKLENNNLQIQSLSTSRDTLLPKLMSGEVRVEF